MNNKIDTNGILIDHICYKCESKEEFENIRSFFEYEDKFVYQAIISKRRIAYIGFTEPLKSVCGDVWFLELSDQKPDNSQKSSVDHIEPISNGISYEEMVARFSANAASVEESIKPHHKTYDIVLPNQIKLKLSPNRLVDKIYREEMLIKNDHNLYTDVLKNLEKYKIAFPNENISQTYNFVKNNFDSVSRSNLVGHITASSVVYKDGKVLVIYHNKLQRYLQPGGHLEDDKTLLDAVKREVFEETGLTVKTTTLFSNEYPLSIDVHLIPESKKKNEPLHLHHDCMFLFEVDNTEIKLDENEVSEYKWVSVDEDFSDGALGKAMEKLKKIR